jgi:hypothetical protein
LHARLRTHYDVIGWNFPDLYLYIEKSWDDEKYWYADEENLEYAVESVMGFRGYYDIEYPHLNRVLEKVYINKVEEKNSSYALTIYYVNKDVQNYFDELKRKERLEKVQELERYNDSLSNAENAKHKISMEKFKNQSI